MDVIYNDIEKKTDCTATQNTAQSHNAKPGTGRCEGWSPARCPAPSAPGRERRRTQRAPPPPASSEAAVLRAATGESNLKSSPKSPFLGGKKLLFISQKTKLQNAF